MLHNGVYDNDGDDDERTQLQTTIPSSLQVNLWKDGSISRPQQSSNLLYVNMYVCVYVWKWVGVWRQKISWQHEAEQTEFISTAI